MRRFLPLLGAILLLGVAPGRADEPSLLAITSPDHEQTFAYGSENHRSWLTMHRHLAVAIDFTNDPYVDQTEPRRYDNFIFDFPSVVLGPDGRTFYYHPPGAGRPVAVATRNSGFLGTEVKLLPSSFLAVEKPHGFLTLTLLVGRNPEAAGL